MKKIIAYSIALIVLAGGMTLYFLIQNKSKVKEIPSQMDMKPSPFVELKAINESNSIKLPAEIIADKYSEINSKVLSSVKTLRVDIGSKVNKGDLLIEFEAPEITAQLASLRSKVVSLESQTKLSVSNYNRILNASKAEGSVSDFALEEALVKMESDKAILNATKADLEQVKSMTDYLIVRAPFSGVITQRNVDIGNLAGPSTKQPLLVLQDNLNLRVQLSVAEKYSPYVALGDSLSFTVRSLGATPFSARVTRKAGALDAHLRSELIEADLRSVNSQLLPGMIAEVTLNLNGKMKTYLVPKTAVGKSDKASYVVLMRDNVKQNRYIHIGAEQGMMIQIIGDFENGTQVLKDLSKL